MAKDFKDTTVGKILDRFSSTGEIGTVETSLQTKSIVILGAVIIISGVAIMALKKYVFK